MNHVVIINGTGGVGKDTLISQFGENIGVGVKSVSIMDRVKNAAKELGWNYGKTDEDRKALAELKDFSDKYWYTPINYALDRYKSWKSYNTDGAWLFITAREPNDIAKLVEAIPEAKTVLITREGIESHGNHADDNVSDYEYDLVFENKEGIQKSSMDFTEALIKLFKENIRACTELEWVNTNIHQVKFFDNGKYGLGVFTVVGCRKYYEYNPNAETPEGSHWFANGVIDVKTSFGEIFKLPFCPYWDIHDMNGKSFADYYNEQPWLKEDYNED